jgi:hypothetical protein
MSAADRQLVWKHRVTLTDKGPALLRLLKCANLDSQRQVTHTQPPPGPLTMPCAPGPLTMTASWGAAGVRPAAVGSGEGGGDEPPCFLRFLDKVAQEASLRHTVLPCGDRASLVSLGPRFAWHHWCTPGDGDALPMG